MDHNTLNLGIGLIVLMGVNIILGSAGAGIDHDFNWKLFLLGMAKAAIVLACFIATYYVGSLNPDIIAIQVGDIEANVTTAIHAIVLRGYWHYAKQVVEKLGGILSGNVIGASRVETKDMPVPEAEQVTEGTGLP